MQLSIKSSDGCTNKNHDNTVQDLGSIYPILIVLDFSVWKAKSNIFKNIGYDAGSHITAIEPSDTRFH